MIDITALKVDISGYRKYVQFLRSPNDDINAHYEKRLTKSYVLVSISTGLPK